MPRVDEPMKLLGREVAMGVAKTEVEENEFIDEHRVHRARMRPFPARIWPTL